MGDGSETAHILYYCLRFPPCFLGGDLVAATSGKGISMYMSDQNESNQPLPDRLRFLDTRCSTFCVDVDATIIAGTFRLQMDRDPMARLTGACVHLRLLFILCLLRLLVLVVPIPLQPTPLFFLFLFIVLVLVLVSRYGVVYLWIKWVTGLPPGLAPSRCVRVHCAIPSLREV